MKIEVRTNSEELCRDLAAHIAGYINHALQHQEIFTLVLTGGNTPIPLYKILAADYSNNIPWELVHFFWGDERHVPFDDNRNNARMAFETLLVHLPVPASNVHHITTVGDPLNSAKQYDILLREYFGHSSSTFDLVLLGLGDNAHTLSLFPDQPVLKEKDKWVAAYFLKEQKMYRITLTAPVVNKSKSVIFLVTGKDKAPAVKKVIEGKSDTQHVPGQLIRPEGELSWWLDKSAASDLDLSTLL